MIVKLLPRDVLEYYDGPILFIATDEHGGQYICVWLHAGPNETEYLCSKVPRAELVTFLRGATDLRHLILQQSKHFRISCSSNSESLIAYPIDIKDIDPAKLPAEGYQYSENYSLVS